MILLDSKHVKLATRLIESPQGLTARQIKSQIKLANPRRAIHYLRQSGMKIKSVPYKESLFPNNPLVKYFYA